MSGFATRAATLDDAEAIARVHVAGWLESYRGLLPDAMLDALSVEQRAELWRRLLGTAGDAPLVRVACDQQGEVVAFGSAGPARDPLLGTEGEVMALYALDRVKRRGVGRMLFGDLMAELAARGCASAGLWVLEDNAVGRAFYAAMGGRPGVTREEHRGADMLREIAYVWDGLRPFSPRA